MGATDNNTAKEKIKSIDVLFEEINELIGIEIENQRSVDILEALEFKVQATAKKLTATPPPFRLDVSIKQDVIEEVARVCGYERIAPQDVPMDRISKQHSTQQDRIATALTELGFFETKNSVFIAPETVPVDYADCFIQVQNPVNKEKPLLCPSPVFNLIQTAQQNIRYHGIDILKFFELGTGFSTQGERNILSLAIIQKTAKQNVLLQTIQQDFLRLCESIGVGSDAITLEPAQDASTHTQTGESLVQLYNQYDTAKHCTLYPIHQLSLVNIMLNNKQIGGCGVPISRLYNREKYDLVVMDIDIAGFLGGV